MLTRRNFADPVDSLAAHTERAGGCLVWTGYRTPSGYGMLSVGGGLAMAHRFVWELANGSIPPGMEVDHICLNRACCDPAHLRLATRHENMRNRDGAQSTSRTGVRNVRAEGAGFRVIVQREHVGTFSTLSEAKCAAEVARNAKFGEFAGRG